MRSLLVIIAILLFLVPFGIPALGILWLIGKVNRDLSDRMTLAALKRILNVLISLSGIDLTVIGRENIPEDRAVLYVSNHRSYFDIVVGYPQVKRLCGFVAKDQMEKIPLLRVWMRRLYCHFLNRDDPRAGMKTIQDCTEQIKAGRSVWICPEGTRIQGEGVGEFKGGSFRIAEKAGAPVVPVAITHTEEVFEKHVPWIRGTKVTIEFGTPFGTAEMDRAAKKSLPEDCRKYIEEMYLRNL